MEVPPADIEARADAALRRLSDTLANEKSFRVHSSATIEDRMAIEQIAQFSRDTVIQM